MWISRSIVPYSMASPQSATNSCVLAQTRPRPKDVQPKVAHCRDPGDRSLQCGSPAPEKGTAMTAQIATILVLLAVVAWFDWICLADIAKARRVNFLTKQAWALLVVITFPIGGVLYLRYGKVR